MKKIYLSVSDHKSLSGKQVSTGFKPKIFRSLEDIVPVWMDNSLCSAVFSTMYRFNGNELVGDQRRRNHNISFIGNTLVYDFDSGAISMKEFNDRYFGKYEYLIIESRNAPKYDYDRFKVMFVTDMVFTHPYEVDKVPGSLKKHYITQYREIYEKFAKLLGFYEYMDKSTVDLCRLCAPVADRSVQKLKRKKWEVSHVD